jgi:hypothetical protein
VTSPAIVALEWELCARTIGLRIVASSARASSVGGISSLSAFEVLRLITNWYLVGACTGLCSPRGGCNLPPWRHATWSP